MVITRTLSSLTIVAPFFNEQDGAETFYKTLCEHLDTLNIPYNLIFVDDGSRDQTLNVLNRIADSDTRVSVLSLSRNFGHQIALSAGIDYADGDAVVVMDSDLQHPPATISEMIEQYETGADIVYAVRENDNNRSATKRRMAQLYYRFLQRTTNVRFVPGAVDFRLTSKNVIESLKTMRETHRYLRGMVPWLGFSHSVVYYQQQRRVLGQSNYTWRKLFQLARHGLFSFSTVPLDVITWLGISVTILGALYLLYVLIATFVIGLIVPGWTSVIVVLLIASGVQLISIGVLAQYIGMIFEQVKGRPLYVLKQERLQSARLVSGDKLRNIGKPSKVAQKEEA